MREPRRDHYVEPATGEDSRAVLDAAIESLGTLRGLEWVGDAGATLHLLASLVAEASSRAPKPLPAPGTRSTPGARWPSCWGSPAPAPGSASPAAQPRTGRHSSPTDHHTGGAGALDNAPQHHLTWWR